MIRLHGIRLIFYVECIYYISDYFRDEEKNLVYVSLDILIKAYRLCKHEKRRTQSLLCRVTIFLGALETTITDIWRMIWSERISTIVMLTGLVEMGTVSL